MYKNKNKIKLLIVPFLLLMVTFFSVSNVSANQVINDGDGSTGGYGINRAICVYYPIPAEKGVKLTITYTPRNISHIFEDVKSSYEVTKLSAPKQSGEYKMVMSSDGFTENYVPVTYDYSLRTRFYDLGTISYTPANFVESDGLGCPTIYARQTVYNSLKVRQTELSDTKMIVDAGGTSSTIDFTTGDDNNLETYVKVPFDENDSDIVFDEGIVRGVCVFTLETRRLTTYDVSDGYGSNTTFESYTTVNGKNVNITMDNQNPGFSSANIIAKASNSFKVNVSKALKVEDFFNADGSCNTNFKGYCEEKDNCHLLALSEESKLSADVSMDEALNRSPSDIIRYESSLKSNFKLGFATCNDLRALLDFANDIYGSIIIFVMIGLVIFGMLDFGKAVMSEKPDANQKAFKDFKTRAIIAVIIVLLPGLLNFAFSLFTEKNEAGYTTCIPRT
jgi:hypothetical protein